MGKWILKNEIGDQLGVIIMVRFNAWEAVAVDHDWPTWWVSLHIRKEQVFRPTTWRPTRLEHPCTVVPVGFYFWLRPVKGIPLVVTDTSLGADGFVAWPVGREPGRIVRSIMSIIAIIEHNGLMRQTSMRIPPWGKIQEAVSSRNAERRGFGSI